MIGEVSGISSWHVPNFRYMPTTDKLDQRQAVERCRYCHHLGRGDVSFESVSKKGQTNPQNRQENLVKVEAIVCCGSSHSWAELSGMLADHGIVPPRLKGNRSFWQGFPQHRCPGALLGLIIDSERGLYRSFHFLVLIRNVTASCSQLVSSEQDTSSSAGIGVCFFIPEQDLFRKTLQASAEL